jgi:hypothetical protein
MTMNPLQYEVKEPIRLLIRPTLRLVIHAWLLTSVVGGFFQCLFLVCKAIRPDLYELAHLGRDATGSLYIMVPIIGGAVLGICFACESMKRIELRGDRVFFWSVFRRSYRTCELTQLKRVQVSHFNIVLTPPRWLGMSFAVGFTDPAKTKIFHGAWVDACRTKTDQEEIKGGRKTGQVQLGTENGTENGTGPIE